MATDNEIKLVEQLLDKTRKRILSWEPTARGDEFVATLGGNVSFTVGSWTQTRDVLTMRDQLGRMLLTVDSEDVHQVSELHGEARRRGLRVDESLEDVLDQLTKLDHR